jgi:cell division protein FtsB
MQKETDQSQEKDMNYALFTHQEMEAEIDRLKDKLKAADEIIKDYARHDDGCSAGIHVTYSCKCRFDERMQAYNQLKDK